MGSLNGINTRNYSQKTNYKCGSSDLDILPFFIQTMSIPGINFNSPEIGGRTGSKFNLASDSVTFNNLSLDIVLDEDYLVYKEIMNLIFSKINVETGTFSDNIFSLWVEMTDDMGKTVMKIEYNNCRFESVGDIQLDVMDDSTETTFSVDIKYDYYSIIYSDNTPTLRV